MYGIGRAVRNFGDAQYVGALVTDTEFRADHNRVVAADFSLKHGANFRWNGNIIAHRLGRRRGRADSNGIGGQLSYNWETRRYSVAGQAEHYDPGFRMDTAFVNRVGITRGWQYQAINFYPEKRFAWIKRVNPFLWVQTAEDRVQGGNELFGAAGAAFQLHALGLPARGHGARARDVRPSALRRGPRLRRRRRASDEVAQSRRQLQRGAGDVLRSGGARFRAGSACSAPASACSRARSSITA